MLELERRGEGRCMMGETLRTRLLNIVRPMDPRKWAAQFTIDWIQEELEGESANIHADDGALTYRINTIAEVLKSGPDRLFFLMLSHYADLYQQEQK